MGCIYLVTNMVNGKKYVGKTIYTMRDRMIGHLRKALKGSENLLHRALRKYGFENFEWKVVIEEDDKGELNEIEIVLIKHWKTLMPDGYNMVPGGEGGDAFSRKSEKDMEKIKEKMRKARTPEIIERVANFHRGRKRSKKTRLAISEAVKGRKAWNKGKKTGPTGRPAWNKGKKGKKHTEESKAKMRAAKVGISRLEETKQKISETKKKRKLPSPFKGKNHTEEAKEKNRQAHLGVKMTVEQIEANRERSKKIKRDEKTGQFVAITESCI